jgi:inner membrane protein
MDNLTHTAVGLFLSRAGLNRWTPHATPILLLAANAPDIDILSAFGGPVNYLHYHRHLTHSVIAMPILAMAAVLVVKAVSRSSIRWLGAFAAALVGVASHLLLDWSNAYGIRPWLPFSGQWTELDINSVVDLWIWAAALVCLVGPFLARLVGSEISSGSLRAVHHGRGFAWLALAFILVYDCGRGVLHARSLETLGARDYADAAPARIAALPDAVNPLRWRGLVETSDFYAVAEVNLAGDFDPTRAAIFHKPDPDPALDVARGTPAFREFLRFSQYPLWRVSPAPALENARLVECLDMRFGTPQAPGFMATALVDEQLRVIRTEFHWGIIRPR